MTKTDKLTDTLCPCCSENFVEEYNADVPGICDDYQEDWESSDYEGDF